MAILEWSEALSVGFEEIDRDHRKLIDMLNDLDDAVASDRATDVVDRILDDLISYTAWHFRHEERLMQSYGDPAFFDHKTEHEKLVDTALALQTRFRDGEQRIPESLLAFLKDWLSGHILGTDKKTGRFLAENAS